MSLLSEPDRQRLREALADMATPVRLLFFTQTLGCETCLVTRQILDELVSLSDRITLEEVNFVLDKDRVTVYGIDRVPAVAVVGETDPGIRFYGAPSGYEFMSLVDAVLLVSGVEAGVGDGPLSEESRRLIAAVDQPVDLQVFVTPT
jgi:alkyl hydroperoxide reductase subunit AhpF